MDKSRKVKVFGLPFAGGNCYSYRDLGKHIAEFIEFAPVEFPGRGRRLAEPLLTNMNNLVEDVFNQIKGELNTGYAIFGHSMGAWVGYELVKRLIKEGLPDPLHLFFSGSQGPAVVKKDKKRDRHLLPRKELIGMLRELGGCPKEVLEDEELVDFFEPIIRADLQVNDTYEYEEPQPFSIPLTAMRGEDEETTYEKLLEWQKETVERISIIEFPGDHFFILDHLPEIGRIISRKLARFIDHST